MKSLPQSFDSLTILRGAFAWWVTFYHVRHWLALPADNPFGVFLNLGYLGVDFFFVLSGFVLFYRYKNFFQLNFWNGFVEFIKLRIARIYPLHFVMSVVFLANPIALKLLSSSGELSDRYSWPYYFASLLLVQNWGFSEALRWNGPAWSISTEAFAYLIFPALLLLLNQIRTRLVMLSLIALSALAFTGLALNFPINSIGDNIPKFGLIRCLFEFSMGAATAWIFGSLSLTNRKSPFLLLIAASTILILGVLVRLHDYSYIPVVVAMLILATACIDALYRRSSFGMMVRLGEISYATYLCHFFIKDWFEFLNIPSLLGATPSLLVFGLVVYISSEFLYRFVEIPGQKILRKALGSKRSSGAAS